MENNEVIASSPVPDGAISPDIIPTAEPPKVFGDKPVNKKEREIKRWITMTVGVILMSISIYFFQTPNNVTLGGMAGLALILSLKFPQFTYGQYLNAINIAILILGLIVLGKQCTVRTIYCSLLYSFTILGFEYIIGSGDQPIKIPLPLTSYMIGNEPHSEMFLELCFSILFFGFGGALVFNSGASSGGTDILALILKKFTNLNVGIALSIFDLIVVLLSALTSDLTPLMYSVMGVFAKSFILDGVIESFGKTKYITVITQHPEAICAYILDVIKHSYTIFDAMGGYSKEPNKILVTVCKRSEAWKLKNKIKELDPKAFVIVTDANEILGKGFDASF